MPPSRSSPLERHPAVDAVGFCPDLDQHLDALPAAIRRLRTDADFASRQVGRGHAHTCPFPENAVAEEARGRLGRCPLLARGRGRDTLLG